MWIAAHKRAVTITAPSGRKKPDSRPLKRKPRKKVSSNNGAATRRATHSIQTGLAVAYADETYGGTMGRPSRMVIRSDRAAKPIRRPIHMSSVARDTGWR